MAGVWSIFELIAWKGGQIMRLSTIWTIPSMSTMERLRRTREWASLATASKLPQRIKYWVVMLEVGKATKDKSNVMGTTVDELLQGLDHK